MSLSTKTFGLSKWTLLCITFCGDRVVTQYFDSQFMGHTTVSDLLKSLKCSLSKLNNRKLLQISMDGLRVNLKLLSLLCVDREKEDADLPKLLNVGSCGLHVVHTAFCTGMPGYRLKNRRTPHDILVSVPWFTSKKRWLHNSEGSTVFPLKFCATQWVEDDRVAERALEIWPNVEKYI